MKKIIILLLAICAYAEVPHIIPQDISPERLPALLNRNFDYLEDKNTNTDKQIVGISTGIAEEKSNSKNKKLYLRDIRAEQRYTGAGQIDDSGQTQMDTIYGTALFRVAGVDKIYRTGVGTAWYMSSGTVDNITLDGTTGQSKWLGSMVHSSTDTYYTSGTTRTIRVSGYLPGSSYYTTLSSETVSYPGENLGIWTVNALSGSATANGVYCRLRGAGGTGTWVSINKNKGWDLSAGRNYFKNVFWLKEIVGTNYDTYECGYEDDGVYESIDLGFVIDNASVRFNYKNGAGSQRTLTLYDGNVTTSGGNNFIAEFTFVSGVITYKLYRDGIIILDSGFDSGAWVYPGGSAHCYVQTDLATFMTAYVYQIIEARYSEDDELGYGLTTIAPVANADEDKRGIVIDIAELGSFLFSSGGGLAIKNTGLTSSNWLIDGAPSGRISLYKQDSVGLNFHVNNATVPVTITYDTDGRLYISTTTSITGNLWVSGDTYGTGISSHSYYYGDGSNLTSVYADTATYAVDAGTTVYADNSGLLNGHDTDYFATASSMTGVHNNYATDAELSASTASLVTVSELSASTASLVTVTELAASTASLTTITEVATATSTLISISSATALLNYKLDESSATATYQNVNQMEDYLTTSSATASYINVNQSEDFAVYNATATYDTNLKKSTYTQTGGVTFSTTTTMNGNIVIASGMTVDGIDLSTITFGGGSGGDVYLASTQTFTGINTFSSIDYDGFVSTAGDTMSGKLNMGGNHIIYTSGISNASDVGVLGNILFTGGAININAVSDIFFQNGAGLDMNNKYITHIDWANSDDGAGSLLDADLLDAQEGAYYAIKSAVASSTDTLQDNIDTNTTAISTTGIQVNTNISGISTNETAISTTGVVVNLNTDHRNDNSQAHSDYLLNTSDTMSGSLDIGTTLDVTGETTLDSVVNADGGAIFANGTNLAWGSYYAAYSPLLVGVVDGVDTYLAIYPSGSTAGEKFRIGYDGALTVGNTIYADGFVVQTKPLPKTSTKADILKMKNKADGTIDYDSFGSAKVVHKRIKHEAVFDTKGKIIIPAVLEDKPGIELQSVQNKLIVALQEAFLEQEQATEEIAELKARIVELEK